MSDTKPETSRDCPHCGSKLSVSALQHDCPECGSPLIDSHAIPTVQLDTNMRQSIADREHSQRIAHALEGKRLAQYQIEKLLGRGGMGLVFLARHLTLERPCAIKILQTEGELHQPREIEAFLAEARMSASLVHPHVVTLHNIGEEDGLHFIEMEYVDGNSLGKYLDEHGAVDPLQATQWMLHISAALTAAHRMQLIHRDIKPANVLVTRSGLGKLADFGLAKRLVVGENAASQMLCGTPSYMAPELFAGTPATTRSDIYAMGITYYSLLAGRLPVAKRSIREIAAFHQTQQIIDVDVTFGHLPGSIRALLARALHRDSSERFSDAFDLQLALQSIYGALQPLRTLVDKALKDVDHSLRDEIPRDDTSRDENSKHVEEQISVVVALEQGRKQTVNIEIAADSETGEEIVRVFSICGRADPEHFERALNLNAAISHGSIGVQMIDNIPHFVMTNAYPRATCDPEEIRSSVVNIAKHSDEVERLIDVDDQH